MIYVARAGDRNDPRLPRHQPRQCDLGGRRALFGAELSQKLDDRLVVLHDDRREARERRSQVGLRVEARPYIHLQFPGQEALSQRSPRNKADAQLFAGLKHAVAFRASVDERVFALDRRDRLNGMRAADGLRARLREAKVQDLSGLD